MIAEGWKQLLLNDICRPRQWPTIPKEKFTSDGYPVYGANGQIGHYSEYTHDQDTIAITCRGATCGTINWVPAYSYITGNAMALDNVDEANVSKRFLYFVLNHWGVADSITGSAQPQITGQSLSKFAFPFPPLTEQKRIAEVLGSVDAAIEATHAVIDQTKKVKQGLLQTLLTQGIGHTKFKDSPLGKIPESWDVLSLWELSNNGVGLQTGPFGSQLHAHDYTESGTPVIMPKDISEQKVRLDTVARVSDMVKASLTKHVVQEGDILFGRRGDIGRCCIITESEAGYLCGTGCLRVRVDRANIHGNYLIKYLQTEYVHNWLNENAVGQTMLNLNTTILGNLLIACPPMHDQVEIARTFDSIDFLLQAEVAKLINLQNLKKGLMNDLFTGQVRVSVNKEKAA